MVFALVGNQNCGKTTLFNSLTGANQHVGNFPGVTVDQKMGEMRDAKGCSVVDLPGIYSMRPYTSEEIVTRDFVLNGHPDGIINIIDATNIERNLYLTLQLLELRIPMVLALNMMDEVRNNGGTINVKDLSARLGIPVVPISAAKGVDRDQQDQEGRYIRQERFAGACSRSFYVGDAVEPEDVSARFEDGILRISLPKQVRKQLPQSTAIAIQ